MNQVQQQRNVKQDAQLFLDLALASGTEQFYSVPGQPGGFISGSIVVRNMVQEMQMMERKIAMLLAELNKKAAKEAPADAPDAAPAPANDDAVTLPPEELPSLDAQAEPSNA